VRRLLRAGKLPGVKVGGGWRISRENLQRMLSGIQQTATKKKYGGLIGLPR
jgi:hypothetical protein